MTGAFDDRPFLQPTIFTADDGTVYECVSLFNGYHSAVTSPTTEYREYRNLDGQLRKAWTVDPVTQKEDGLYQEFLDNGRRIETPFAQGEYAGPTTVYDASDEIVATGQYMQMMFYRYENKI